MLNNHMALMALRNRVIALEVTTTGSTTLQATSTDYVRTSGDFVADGFVRGQELLPAGFATNAPATIKNVAPLVLTVNQVLIAQAAGAGRSLTVGIPSLRAWENRKVDPQKKLWHIKEEYIPGPIQNQETKGPLGWVREEPIYFITLRGLSGTGAAALFKAAGAVVASFPPRDALTLADGTILRVRSLQGPTHGKILQDEDGFAVIVVTIPLWVRTQNTI